MPLTPTNIFLGTMGSLMFGMYNFVVRRKFRAVFRGYLDVITNLITLVKKRKYIKKRVSEKEIYKFLTLRLLPRTPKNY